MSVALTGALRKTAEELRQQVKNARYINDPVLWAKDKLGITLWSTQRKIAESIVTNKKTAVKSCFGIGKTLLAAVITCWWVDVHPTGDTVVVTTAPSNHQVKAIMWENIRRLHKLGNLKGTITEEAMWKSDDRNIVAYGRKPADNNTTNVMQGEHKKYTLVVIDEGGGVPDAIWVGADAITTMPTNRIFAIGNPDSADNEFGNIFLKEHGYEDWAKFSVSAFQSPNFTDEGKELPDDMLSRLVSREWVDKQTLKWGKQSRFYITRILAEFPQEAFDTLFPAALVARAQDRVILPSAAAPTVLGVDVARFGGDRTVVMSCTDGDVSIVDAWDKTDTNMSARRVHKLAMDLKATEVRIDGVGIGAGVVDTLVTLCANYYRVIEVNGGARSPDPKRWLNYRAFLYENLRDGLRDGLVNLPQPQDTESDEQTLADELEGSRYKFVRQVLAMESKDDMRRRGVKSPDFADALTYAVAPLDMDAPLSDAKEGDTFTIDAMDMLEMVGSPIAPV